MFIRARSSKEPSIDHAMLAAAMLEIRSIRDAQAHFANQIEARWEEALPSGINAA